MENPQGLTGLSTGFQALDRMGHGWQPGNLVILAARSGMGKTAMALNLAAHVALQEAQPVLFFSLEMTGAELMGRLLKSIEGTAVNREKLLEAKRQIDASPLIVEDDPTVTVSRIKARARQEQHRRGSLGLVVVDYLGKVKPEEAGRYRDNRAYELEAITWGLKAMAKELQVPVIALCQLNRNVEGRTSKKQMLSDLRDSGAIEQDADMVLFVHREDYYDKNTRRTGEADLMVAKHRNGPTGEIVLSFNAALTRFAEFPAYGPVSTT